MTVRDVAMDAGPGAKAASTIVATAARIAEEVAGPASADVDRDARFPHEALDALRAERLLGALVPTGLGGLGATIPDVAGATFELGKRCASSAMVFAMHHMQASCLVRHGRTPALEQYLSDLAARQLLLASATTEVGVGGDVRTSICALERSDGRFRLQKAAPVISYGEHADAVLATARRGPDSASSDQVLVLCTPPGLSLRATSGWDTLGFRGTCSLGFALEAEGDEALVLPDSFGDISTETMLPVSHVLWSAVWLGIASAAVDTARKCVQAEARKSPGATPATAPHLAELTVVYQQMAELVRTMAREFERSADDRESLSRMSVAIAFNNLKISSSRMVIDIVGRAMGICGMAGYREDSPHSLGRLLRDAHAAPLMVNNDRLIANNAQFLLAAKEIQ
ncbi:MAG: acyl-CoA dehydrogenase family protein [Acidimicrobiales bacterium]